MVRVSYSRVNIRKRKSFLRSLSLNNLLILINVVVFFLVFPFLVFDGGETVIRFVALSPELFFQGFIWTLFTSMFMHGSFTHLFVNMLSMFFIGGLVERIIGRKRFFWFYMIAGIIAGLFFVGLAFLGQYVPNGTNIFGSPTSFAVGASGALFGLGGLLAVLLPKLRVLVFFILPMPLWLAMVVLMFGLWAISATAGLPVGNTAHFGGLVVGVAYGFYLRNKYSRKVKMLNKMFR